MVVWEYDLRKNQKGSVSLIETGSVTVPDGMVLKDVGDVAAFMCDCFQLDEKVYERTYMLALDTACHVKGVFLLSTGSQNLSVVEPHMIFTRLLLLGVKHFLLVHNHPSTSPVPSAMDVEVTLKVKQCSDMMQVDFLDHVIVGTRDNYYSFRENSGLVTKGGKNEQSDV